MSTKSIFMRQTRVILITLFILFLPPLLEAQVSTQVHPVQHLSWTGGEYDFIYEVIIEKEENGAYHTVVQEFTKMSFFNAALHPGNYRYRVIPYDYLEQTGIESEWENFEVRHALRPILYDSQPEAVYTDTEYVLDIVGENLSPDAEIYLRRQDGKFIIAPVGKSVLKDGSGALLVFDKDDLASGDYELYVINPGGFETHRSGFTIASAPIAADTDTESAEPESTPESSVLEPVNNQGSLGMYISTGWAPMFPIFGDGLGQSPVFPGLAFRFGAIYSTPSPFGAGLELAAYWNAFDIRTNKKKASLQHALTVELNFVTKVELNQAMSLGLRLGAGLSLPLSAKNSFYADMGFSFQWMLLKQLYFETGLDFVYLFMGFPSGGLRPWLGLGWEF